MHVKVVDTSALAALLFSEPQAVKIRNAVKNVRLAAPELLRYEIASVALKKHHSENIPHTAIVHALDILNRWDMDWYDISPVKTFETSMTSGLSACDASYLWLARELQADLLTLDTQLQKAFKKYAAF